MLTTPKSTSIKGPQCVVAVGEDVDVLVIMAASTNFENSCFLKLGRGKAEDALYCAATMNIAPHITDDISFLHAFSGCGTTSALFRQGKKKFISVLYSTELQQVVNIFRDENACMNDVDEARQKVLITMSGKNSEETLDSLRFKLFKKSLEKIISI
ncbi:hypothetical protein AVEN_259319-1 [Araneus ventricosus]|uniref:Uncharacterized protein n=1 Tax=Araneus ventricosus TaxID=182803 RepID=A0A4Y2S2L4_ARAVE|nr:hypothetical protein AVEN_259319-1 [Araneus ventricosus]